MKKILFIAAVALAAAACSKTFDTNPAADEKPISFGSWNEVLTKARATGNDNTAFANGDKFDVFGVKTIGSDNSVVFNSEDVTATVSGSTVTWDYAPHRFWDSHASSYTFYAVMPNDALASANPETGVFTSNTIEFTDPTAFSEDIMVANKKVVPGTANGSSYTYSTSPVALEFNHIASCVDLFVKKDVQLKDVTVTVTDVTLVGIDNKGTFSVSGYDNTTKEPEYSWTPTTGTLADYSVISNASVEAVDKTTYTSHVGSATTMTAGEIFTGYVFMPQDLDVSKQKIKISYKITSGSDVNTYTDVIVPFAQFYDTDTDDNSGNAIVKWEKSTHYIYYITIGANAITFTASVKDWATTEINGYHYILN